MGTIAVLVLDGVYAGAMSSAADVASMTNESALARLREHDPQARKLPRPWKALLVGENGATPRSASGDPVPVDLDIAGSMRRFDAIYVAPFVMRSGPSLERRLTSAERIATWLAAQQARGALIAANYSAVFVLAAAGLLEQTVTTVPFALEREFRRRFPQVKLDLTRAVIHDGPVMSAAAVSAGYALCWHCIEKISSVAVAQRFYNDLFFEVGGLPSAARPRSGERTDPLVERAQTWLAHHLAAQVNMAELAEYAAVSERTLLRRFQAALDMTPHKYLRDLRLNTAKRGLELTRFQVEQIARGVGYGDVAFFSQLFKAHTGMTPSEYRRVSVRRRQRRQGGV
jgi:transcriptional regulator GlxA family with amidase domain